MDTGAKIRDFRKKKGLTLEEFAEPMGFSFSYVAEVERGDREPSPRFLLILKTVYGLNLSEEAPIVAEEQAEYYTKEEKKYVDILIRGLRSDNESFKIGIKGFLEVFVKSEAKRQEQAEELPKAATGRKL